jgi:TonB family protein
VAIRVSAARKYAGVVAMLIAARAHPALAQSTSAPPLVAPRAVHAGDVSYPKGASTEAVVIVELLIDVSGNVQDARIVEGQDPFAAAVIAASRSWSFEPAKRGDITVAAKVRMRILFRPPAAKSEAPQSPTSTPAKPRSNPTDKNSQIDEVRVQGHHEEAGEISMGASEVRQIPGAFGDAFRAIDTFPGVTPIASGVPFFFVRGAPPGDTGYFLDGIRLPLLFHVGVGPSIVQPGLVDRLDFFPANFPAQYGRVTGGVVAATTVAPPTEPHGEGNIRLFDAGGFVETPFANGQGTAMIGGRYSYTGLLLPIFAPDTHLDYWDYQSRVTWKVDAKDEVSAFWLGSHDYLAQDKVDSDNLKSTDKILGTDFHRLDLRWDRKTSDHAHLRVATTLGIDSSGDSSGTTYNKMIGFRAEYENRISPDLKLRMGSDVEWDHYDVQDDTPGAAPPGLDPTSIYVPRNDVTGGVHADVVWKILPRVEIVPGLRGDVFTSRRVSYPPPYTGDVFAVYHVDHATAIPAFDPRMSVQVEITKNVSYFSALGLAHQVPSYLATFPAINIGGLDQGLQTSVQTSQGVDVHLPFDITARGTLFYTKYFGLTDATASCPGTDFTSPGSATNPCIRNRVDGRAYGAELLVRRSFAKRLSGWLSYTLSRSTRETHPLLGPANAISEILSEYDRTHVLTLAGAYDLGKRWRAGARFYYYSGRPYSPSVQGLVVPPYDSLRFPAFWRIDLRLEKSWTIGKNGRIAFVFEGLNVTLNKEAVNLDCPSSSGTTAAAAPPYAGPRDNCPYEELGPVSIPSVGLEGSF